MKTKPLNHIYQSQVSVLTKVGDVALCGHVKKRTLGFDKSANTCTPCVQAAFGHQLKKIKTEKL